MNAIDLVVACYVFWSIKVCFKCDFEAFLSWFNNEEDSQACLFLVLS